MRNRFFVDAIRKLACGISALCLILAVPATGASTGNGAPSGAHYNLNIHGVPKGKHPTMTGGNGHDIFVPLNSTKSGVSSNPNFGTGGTGAQTQIVDAPIWLVPGDTFQVCDANGFDLAYGCDDTYLGDWKTMVPGSNVPLVSTRNGAVFQLPCNTNLNGLLFDSNHDGVPDTPLDHLVGCNMAVDATGHEVPLPPGSPIVPTASYQVWARALGKPGGNAIVTTCATVNGELECSLENVVMTRTSKKSLFVDVTDAVTSLVIGFCQDFVVTLPSGDTVCVANPAAPVVGSGTVTFTRVALFAGNTQDWFWNFDNAGLRLAQLRFYDGP